MKTKGDKSRLVGVASLIFTIINPMLTMCACGYMDWLSLPGNIIAFTLAWKAFLAGRDKRVLTRVIITLACVITTIVLLKNGADILWYGHDPLLK